MLNLWATQAVLNQYPAKFLVPVVQVVGPFELQFGVGAEQGGGPVVHAQRHGLAKLKLLSSGQKRGLPYHREHQVFGGGGLPLVAALAPAGSLKVRNYGAAVAGPVLDNQVLGLRISGGTGRQPD